MPQFFKVETISKLRKVIINNPRKKNALNAQAYQELSDILNEAAVDDSIAVCAITGEGEYYSSGNDFTAFMNSSDPAGDLQKSRILLKNLIKSFYEFPKPLICVINGPCIGIAATTAALTDVIYASESAFFYTPFSALGLCVEGCGSYTFPRLLGKSKANEVLLFNHKLSAKEAYQFGMVAEVYSKSDLNTKLWPKIIEFSELSATSLKITKKLLQKFDMKKLDEVAEAELDELYQRLDKPDFIEFLVNFIGKKSKL